MKLEHVAFNVADPVAVAAWYCEHCGLRVVRHNPERAQIQNPHAALGIELGSTRIKAVLIGSDNMPIASGGHGWENTLQDGIWTYPLEEVWEGIQASFAELQENVKTQHGVTITRLKAVGFSAMMHGYMVFDAEGNQLVPFRTWRNNMQGAASEKLTELFGYPIPQRWSIAHLYQAILNKEKHVGRIAHATTLAGYVHWKLAGRKTVGIGEASGMFPIDIKIERGEVALQEARSRVRTLNVFCYATPEVVAISRVEERGDLQQDGSQVEVRFIYRLRDVADWAADEAFQRAFPQAAEMLEAQGAPREARTVLVLTTDGWVDERLH